MKKQSKTTQYFKKGELYPCDDVARIPMGYDLHFEKPTFRDMRKIYGNDWKGNLSGRQLDKKDDMSDYDKCVKSLKIVTTVYHN